MRLPRRSWILVASAIILAAVVCVTVVSLVLPKKDSEIDISPAPLKTYEHHTAWVKFVVSNYRSTDVWLEIRVDGSTKYSGTVLP